MLIINWKLPRAYRLIKHCTIDLSSCREISCPWTRLYSGPLTVSPFPWQFTQRPFPSRHPRSVTRCLGPATALKATGADSPANKKQSRKQVLSHKENPFQLDVLLEHFMITTFEVVVKSAAAYMKLLLFFFFWASRQLHNKSGSCEAGRRFLFTAVWFKLVKLLGLCSCLTYCCGPAHRSLMGSMER